MLNYVLENACDTSSTFILHEIDEGEWKSVVDFEPKYFQDAHAKEYFSVKQGFSIDFLIL